MDRRHRLRYSYVKEWVYSFLDTLASCFFANVTHTRCLLLQLSFCMSSTSIDSEKLHGISCPTPFKKSEHSPLSRGLVLAANHTVPWGLCHPGGRYLNAVERWCSKPAPHHHLTPLPFLSHTLGQLLGTSFWVLIIPFHCIWNLNVHKHCELHFAISVRVNYISTLCSIRMLSSFLDEIPALM